MLYEIHVAADVVREDTKASFLELGFKENQFLNYRCVNDSVWRATWKSQERLTPSAWEELIDILSTSNFEGTLIEEVFDDCRVTRLKTNSFSEEQPGFPELPLSKVPAGAQKECDIHLTVDTVKTPESTLTLLDKYFLASVDRPGGGKRIYTVTCERFSDGKKIKEELAKFLELFPNLQAKIYIEKITRYFRQPDTAQVLPRVSTADAKAWLEEVLSETA